MTIRVKKYLPILFIVFLCSCLATKKDTVSVENSKETNDTSFCYLKSFWAKPIQGKIYINWTIKSNAPNYYFVLEKITNNGENVSVVDVKKGVPSPADNELLFGHIDTDSVNTEITYRVSAILSLKQGSQIVLYSQNRNMLKNQPSSVITIKNNISTLLSSQK